MGVTQFGKRPQNNSTYVNVYPFVSFVPDFDMSKPKIAVPTNIFTFFKWLNTMMVLSFHIIRYIYIERESDCHIEQYVYKQCGIRSTAKINKLSNNVTKAIHVGWIEFFTLIRDLQPSNHFPTLFGRKIRFNIKLCANKYDVQLLPRTWNLFKDHQISFLLFTITMQVRSELKFFVQIKIWKKRRQKVMINSISIYIA